MTDRATPDYGLPVEVGSRWQRNPPGREVVEVQRVWDYSALGDPAVLTVRAHPISGGRPLVAPVDWFIERYTRVTPPGSDGGVS